MQIRWDCDVLNTEKKLILSDHPVCLFVLPVDDLIGYCWFWPITENQLFVAATRNTFTIERRELDDLETKSVNHFTARDTNLWLMSRDDFTKDQVQYYDNLWKNNAPLNSTFTDHEWHHGAYHLPDFTDKFPFIKSRE